MNQKGQRMDWQENVEMRPPKMFYARLMSQRMAKIPNKVGICQTDT